MWQCQFCTFEFKLFCNDTLAEGETWKDMFDEIWRVRDLWSSSDKKSKRVLESKRIQVFARIRPVADVHALPQAHSDSSSEEDRDKNSKDAIVHLPLHQRLQLLKLSSKNPSLSTGQAIRLLQRQGDWWPGRTDVTPPTNATSSDKHCESDEDELFLGKQRFGFRIHTLLEESGMIGMTVPGTGMRDFRFNAVFGPSSRQDGIYERVGKQLVMDTMNGWNSTLFVYGQTGSGKTYTMFGADDACAVGDNVSQAGIVPRLCADLLAAMRSLVARTGVRAGLHASYVEVYGDQVFDLLKGGLPVGQSRAAAQRYVLSGEARTPVESEADIRSVLARGEESKTKAATRMNERSTRAHSLLILHMVQSNRTNPSLQVESTLFLGDLGGSERTSNSQVTGVQLTEANNINLGLLSLKQVITALNAKQKHIPYANDKLTMLLSSGLGGNSRTRVIVCAHPQHGAETLQSLRFGEECSLIKVGCNERYGASLVLSQVKEIDKMVAELEAEIRAKERWDTVETRRQDTNIEKGTLEETIAERFGGEVIKTTKLVGAEEERKRLEQLLFRKRELLGFE